MSDYDTFIEEPTSIKNVLVEVDIGLVQTMWFTYEPNIWQWDVTDFAVNTKFDFGSGSFGYGSFGFGGTADTGVNAEIFNVGSVIVSGISYTSVSTLATLRATGSTYLFDSSTQLMLIHFEDDKWPDEFGGAIKLGVTNGWASQLPGIYNNTEYKAGVLSVPSFTESVDPLVFGLISFNTGAIVLENTDGELDTFKDIIIIGSETRVKFGGEGLEYADYITIFTSRIKDFSMNERTVSLNVADTRESLSTPIPENIFDALTYPDISDDDRNKQIPLGYGVIRNALATCTNEEESPAPATDSFKICDTTFHSISAITTVYDDGNEVTPVATDLTVATFTLATAGGYQELGLSDKAGGTATGLATTTQYYFKLNTDKAGVVEYDITTAADVTYAAVIALLNTVTSGLSTWSLVEGDLRNTSDTYGSDSTIKLTAGKTGTDLFVTLTDFAAFESSVKGSRPSDNDVTVDFTGYTDGGVIDNALDVIKDLLLNYTPALFTTDFFNTTEWNVATALVDDISVFIEDSNIIDVIEEICNTVQGSFKIQSDGLYTFKLHNTAQGPQKTIQKEEFLQDIEVEYRSEEYVSSALVKYNQNWDTGKFRQSLYKDEEQTQLTKYNSTKRRTFETLLTTEDNANNLGRAIVLRNKDIIPVFTIVTKTRNMDLSVFNTVNVIMDRTEIIWYGEVKCEVIGINVDFDSFQTELILRYIHDVVAPTEVDNPVGGLFYGEGKTAEKITGFYGSGFAGGFYQNPEAA